MNVLELDEAQGLTLQMVREWLANLDPAIMPSACIADDIIAVSELCGETPQALLREINPRMRKGMPSQAARTDRGHNGGMWIGCRGELGNGGTIVFVCFESDSEDGLPLAIWDGEEWEQWEVEPEEIVNDWYFWPCDANGNKVRWPVDANGEML